VLEYKAENGILGVGFSFCLLSASRSNELKDAYCSVGLMESVVVSYIHLGPSLLQLPGELRMGPGACKCKTFEKIVSC